MKILVITTLLMVGSLAFAADLSPPTIAVELSWEPATEREDGAALTPEEVKGYKIRYGTDESLTSNTLDVEGLGTTITDLPSGVWYFAIATTDSDGFTGAFSEIISTKVPSLPTPPSWFKVITTTTVQTTVEVQQ